jgi:ribosomal protein S18 acetylase RimI-like enzyme
LFVFEISGKISGHCDGLYLWFIGVRPDNQNNGVGKTMMEELLAESQRMRRPVYLETSTHKNLPWYRKFGLEVYQQLNFGYDLFLIRSVMLHACPPYFYRKIILGATVGCRP